MERKWYVKEEFVVALIFVIGVFSPWIALGAAMFMLWIERSNLYAQVVVQSGLLAIVFSVIPAISSFLDEIFEVFHINMPYAMINAVDWLNSLSLAIQILVYIGFAWTAFRHCGRTNYMNGIAERYIFSLVDANKESELEKSNRCPSCGTELDKKVLFCAKCGTKVR